jgi:hypothetical protein
MDVRSKNLFKDMSYAKNYEFSSETKVGQNAKPFILKKGIMYKVGQDNRMHSSLNTSEAQIVLKELHERMGGR